MKAVFLPIKNEYSRNMEKIKMIHIVILGLCAFLILAPSTSNANDHTKQAMGFNQTNLPIPRFVSLRSDEVNMRTGPGLRYPIRWVFRKEGLPVEVIREFEHWREIRDMDGETGWVHKSLLSGQRYAIVKDEMQVLYKKPNTESKPVLKLEAGVVSRILECENNWCQLEIASYTGWIKQNVIWGVYPKETFE